MSNELTKTMYDLTTTNDFDVFDDTERDLLETKRLLISAQAKMANKDLKIEELQAYYTRDLGMLMLNADFFRGIVDECAKHLGPEVFIADDGSIMQDPLRLRVPELVAAMRLQLAAAQAAEKIRS